MANDPGPAQPIDPALMQERHRGTLTDLLGVRFVEGSRERIVAELTVRKALLTAGGRLHGGTLMALADILGATGAAVNLPPGTWTTTLESKTNFFAGTGSGTIRAEATPVHRGRQTMVWQTRITDESGRLLSLTVQTQMVLARRGEGG